MDKLMSADEGATQRSDASVTVKTASNESPSLSYVGSSRSWTTDDVNPQEQRGSKGESAGARPTSTDQNGMLGSGKSSSTVTASTLFDGSSMPLNPDQDGLTGLSLDLTVLSGDNQEVFKQIMQRVIEMCTDFKLRDKVLNYAELDDTLKTFDEPLPRDSTELTKILDTFQKHLLPYSSNFSSPYAMGFPDAGNSVAAITGAVMSDFLNQNLITSFASPVGTVIEMVVLNWIRELVGYEHVSRPRCPRDVGGFVTTGGVSSNTVSLLLAREAAFPNTLYAGVANIKSKYAVLIPADIDHYCYRQAAGWLGIGEQNVIAVPTKCFKFDLDALQAIIHKLQNLNIKIVALCCYAGDSRSMTCDNFPALRKICDAHDIWMHVDGCHGTQLLFSEKLRQTVEGIELADSITFDPHKVLCVPYVCSVVLLKDPKNLILRTENVINGDEHSFGSVTAFFGSRSFDSLKLYLLIKHLGLGRLGAMIEKRHEMAVTLAKKVAADPDLVLVSPNVDMNSVMFMYVPCTLLGIVQSDEDKGVKLMNEINYSIVANLIQSGDVFLHTFNIPDSSDVFKFKAGGRKLQVIRFVSGNPLLRESHLGIMLDLVKRYGKDIMEETLKADKYA